MKIVQQTQMADFSGVSTGEEAVEVFQMVVDSFNREATREGIDLDWSTLTAETEDTDYDSFTLEELYTEESKRNIIHFTLQGGKVEDKSLEAPTVSIEVTGTDLRRMIEETIADLEDGVYM